MDEIAVVRDRNDTDRVDPAPPATCQCNGAAGGCNRSSKCIRDLWLFRNFHQDDYTLLRTIGRQKVVSRGKTVYFQGAPADELFLLKAGRVKLSKCIEDGSEVILDFRRKGDILGEDSFMDSAPFPVSAIALEDTVTCGVSRDDLEKLILQVPSIGLVIMRNMCERISSLTDRLESMAIGNLEEKLYRVLLGIAKRHGRQSKQGCQLPFFLTHEELGFLVNAHRVSVTKAMNNLRKSGRIIKNGKTYSFPDGLPAPG